MARPRLKGSTDQSVTLYIVDDTDGTPEQGVAYNTTSIALWYRREGSAKVAMSLVSLASTSASHTDSGLIHVDDGVYRLDLPDAAVASGAGEITVGGSIPNMVVLPVNIPLVDYNNQDAVRLGLTSLPNAAADAAGGLPISDAGGLDLDAILEDTGTTIPATLATIDGNIDSVLVDTSTTIPASLTTIDNEIAVIDGIVDDILVDTSTTIPASLTTIDTNVDAVLVDTGTTLPATLATIDGNVDSVLVDTSTTIPATLTTIDNEIAVIDGIVDDILVDTAAIPTVSAIANGVFDETVVGNTTTGTFGAAVNDIHSNTASIPTAAAITTAVWDKASSSHTTAGTFGAYVDAAISSVSGGSGGSTWTDTEKSHIRERLGIDGTSASPSATPTLATAVAVAALNNITAADVYTHFTTGTNEDAFKADVSAISASATADAVLNRALSSHVTAGTVGKALGDIDTNATSAKGVTDKIDTGIEADGGVYRFTTNMLEQGPTGSGTVNANVTQVMGTALTEGTSGRVAGNMSTLFNNGDAASTKTQNDIGTATVSGTVAANLTQIKGTAITETTSGRLAANVSTVFDNGDAATTKTADDIGTATVSGTVAANITQVLGTAVTETTTGRLAGNLSVFLDNGDAASAKTQDDVGSGATSVTADLTSIKGTALTETTAGRLAQSLSTFLDNGDAASTTVVSDINDPVTVSGTVDANVTQVIGTALTETSTGRVAGNLQTWLDAGATTTATLSDITTIKDRGNDSGTGAYTITITVTDDQTPAVNLQNATVRLTEGATSVVAQTSATGTAVVALDAATYDVAITKAGYTGQTTTLVVAANASQSYTLAQDTITPAAGANTSTGVLTVYDEDHNAESGVTISCQMTAGPGTAGNALDTKVRTQASTVAGLVQFENLIRGATYQVWRSTFTSSSVFGAVATSNAKVSFTVPDAASFDLPEIIGADE